MEYGLDKVFWYGRSTCENIGGDFFCQRDDWITNDGWKQLLKYFANSVKTNEEDDNSMDLLWLYAPDYTLSGKMTHIKEVVINGTVEWKQNDECAGFIISGQD